MNLSPSQTESLFEALLSAFPSHSTLERMVLFQLDENLDEIVYGDNLQDCIFELIKWAETHGQMSELISGAQESNPSNPELRNWLEAHAGGERSEASEQYSVHQEIQTKAVSVCPCCDGKGAFDAWQEPCELTYVHKKIDCPTCEGKCFFVGAEEYAQCPNCKGKGAFDAWGDPCMIHYIHKKIDCPTCEGKCFLPFKTSDV